MIYKAYKDGSDYKLKKETVRTYYKSITFNTSDSFQTFAVPSNITSLIVDCVASKGFTNSTRLPGKGGRVQCMLSVTPNQTLYIVVGGIPASYNSGAYNASDIRTDNTGITDSTSLASRLIVAGGGGSVRKGGDDSSTRTGIGGDGGGLTGQDGTDPGGSAYAKSGKGGTQSAGGARGSGTSTGGTAGSFGLGGTASNAGGDGGAGWYGGGSGGRGVYGSNVCGAGGGGSSYTDSTLCSNVVHTQGYQDDAGFISITYQSDSTDYDYYEDANTYKAFNIQTSVNFNPILT